MTNHYQSAIFYISKKIYKFKESCIKRYLRLIHKDKLYSYSVYPYIKIQEKSNGIFDVFFKNKYLFTSKSFDCLKGNYESIFIVGSGPSVSKQNTDKLKGKTVIFLNGSILTALEKSIIPMAYIVMDANFILNRLDIINKIQKGTNIILSPSAIKALAFFSPKTLQENNIFIFFHITERNSENKIYFDFSSDPKQGFADGGTVMSIGIQLAYFCKADRTYLVGLDIGNANQPRFYETNKNKQKSGLLKDYQEKILPFMKEASLMFKDEGMRLYNCSPVSKLPYDIIPYSDYLDK